MQHHQAPTRLLDWTASPYVAAYFAVQASTDAAGVEVPGVVWVAHARTVGDYCGARYGRGKIWPENEFEGRAMSGDAEPVLYLVLSRNSRNVSTGWRRRRTCGAPLPVRVSWWSPLSRSLVQ